MTMENFRMKIGSASAINLDFTQISAHSGIGLLFHENADIDD